jgi:hypothetical protein
MPGEVRAQFPCFASLYISISSVHLDAFLVLRGSCELTRGVIILPFNFFVFAFSSVIILFSYLILLFLFLSLIISLQHLLMSCFSFSSIPLHLIPPCLISLSLYLILNHRLYYLGLLYPCTSSIAQFIFQHLKGLGFGPDSSQGQPRPWPRSQQLGWGGVYTEV